MIGHTFPSPNFWECPPREKHPINTLLSMFFYFDKYKIYMYVYYY